MLFREFGVSTGFFKGGCSTALCFILVLAPTGARKINLPQVTVVVLHWRDQMGSRRHLLSYQAFCGTRFITCIYPTSPSQSFTTPHSSLGTGIRGRVPLTTSSFWIVGRGAYPALWGILSHSGQLLRVSSVPISRSADRPSVPSRHTLLRLPGLSRSDVSRLPRDLRHTRPRLWPLRRCVRRRPPRSLGQRSAPLLRRLRPADSRACCSDPCPDRGSGHSSRTARRTSGASPGQVGVQTI